MTHISVTHTHFIHVISICHLHIEYVYVLLQNHREYDFPDQCDSIVGKRMLLKLKRNEFNAKHTASSISVQQFSYCENLNDQFNEASSEVVHILTSSSI